MFLTLGLQADILGFWPSHNISYRILQLLSEMTLTFCHMSAKFEDGFSDSGVWGLGLGSQGSGFRVSRLGFALGSRVYGFRTWILEFMASGLGV